MKVSEEEEVLSQNKGIKHDPSFCPGRNGLCKPKRQLLDINNSESTVLEPELAQKPGEFCLLKG